METPYTKKRYAQYRGPSTSDDYNRRIEEVYQDLTVLYNRARLSEVEKDELYRRMAKDQLSISRLVTDLEDRIATLEAAENRITFHSASQVITPTSPGPNPLNDPEFGIAEDELLTHDGIHGQLTLPRVVASSISKLRFTGPDGYEVIPPGLEMRVVGTAGTADTPVSQHESANPEYSLYRKPGLVWERNVIADAPNVNGAQMTVYVRVPTDLFTTDKANSLIIHPFPQFDVTIEEIAYSTRVDPLLTDGDGYSAFNSGEHYSGEAAAVGYVVPGGWTGAEDGNDAIVDSGPKNFVFESKVITALRIKLRQDSYYAEGSKYIYTYGLSQLDLRFDKFLPEGRAFIEVKPKDGETISSINSVTPQIWNVSPASVNDVFSYRVLWETNKYSNIYTTDPVPFSERCWIEVTLRSEEGWSPALSGLIVDYS